MPERAVVSRSASPQPTDATEALGSGPIPRPHIEGEAVIPTQPDRDAETPWPLRLADLAAVSADPQDGAFASTLFKLLVTPEEAAAILSVGRTTIYELMATRQLESVQIKSCRRIPVAALQRFVQRLLEGS
jgi:excisionase family DNA binding protein